jgi:ankyrin repeat protein
LVATNGHEAVVLLLLEHNAYVNAEEKDGQTALLLAARRGHEAVVQLLQSNDGNLATPSSLLSPLSSHLSPLPSLLSAANLRFLKQQLGSAPVLVPSTM